jgi:sodium transport system permease protein
VIRDALILFRKEMRESLRDRRLVIGAFVVPLFVIFLLTHLMSTLEQSLGKEAQLELVVVGSRENPLAAQLQQTGRTQISVITDEKKALEVLKSGKTSLVLSLPDQSPGEQIQAKAYYDSSRPLSLAAFAGLRQAVAEANSRAVKQALSARGIDLAESEPMALRSQDIGQQKGVAGGTWLMLLPYLVILWSYYGGSSLASDMVAGEKEKKTLETLLLTPVSRVSIAAGKLLALSAICLISGLMSILGLYLSSLASEDGGGLKMGLDSFAAFVLVLAPLVLMYAGALLAVSSLSRSMREAQTYLTVLSFLVMTPAIMSQFIGLTGADRTEWVRWTPILNTSMVMSQSLRGRVDWLLAAQSALIALALAAFAWWLCVRLFSRETILQRV